MRWLLNNWAGRLYVVIQISCLIVTSVLMVKFVRESQLLEEQDIFQTRKNYGAFEYGARGQRLPPDEEAKLKQVLEENHKLFSEVRRDKAIQYLWPNLGVPLVFGVGLFVAKGFPTRKRAA